MKSKRRYRKTVVGTVISNKMSKTITVEVQRLVKYPRFEKYIKKYTIYKAHDEKNEAKTGDRVELMETRPLSKTKRWRLVKILEKTESEVEKSNS